MTWTRPRPPTPRSGRALRKLIIVKRMMHEMLLLLREHKLYFLAPLLLTLVGLSVLVYYVGPTVVLTFIYAGV